MYVVHAVHLHLYETMVVFIKRFVKVVVAEMAPLEQLIILNVMVSTPVLRFLLFRFSYI